MTTVLIVEDDLLNVRVFSKILTKRGGLDVRHTEDVEEVMAMAQTGVADIILMDISLSHSTYHGKHIDGIKITQMLKANPMSAKVPIVLCTAHGGLEEREMFLKASGADEYLTKPVVDQQQFLETILSCLL